MKVMLVTTSYPLREGLVSGVFVKKLVEQLETYMDVTVVTPGDDVGVTDPGIKYSWYAPQKLQRLAHRPGGIPVALKSEPWTWLLLPSLIVGLFVQCIIQCRNKDAVIANWSVNGVIAGFAAKLFNIPLITVLRGSDVSTEPKGKKKNITLMIAVQFSTKVVCVSDAFYDEMICTYEKHKDKFIMIPNGIGSEFLDIKNRNDQSTVVLTTVGNLNSKKGVHLIIEACRVLHDKGIPVVLNVIGDGPDKQRLIDLSVSLKLSEYVNFEGVVMHDDIPKLLERTSIFVFASFSEGRANVLLEAMAAGLPIVASDIGANRELITHDENGYLFKAGDSADLAKNIEVVALSLPLKRRLAAAAREHIVKNGLSWSATGVKYRALIESCVEQG